MDDEHESQVTHSEISAKTLKSQAAPSTLTNSFLWRIVSGLSYFFGSLIFTLGSIVYFPVFDDILDSASWSAWLYTVGASAFLVCDLMEWNHYRPSCFSSTVRSEEFKIGFNYILALVSTLCYLVSCIFYIPEVDEYDAGENIFLAGSALLCVCQAWKCHRICVTPPTRTPLQNIKDEAIGFTMCIFSGVGGLLFVVGTVLFGYTEQTPDLIYYTAVITYVVGSLFYFVASILQLKSYFFTKLEGYKHLS